MVTAGDLERKQATHFTLNTFGQIFKPWFMFIFLLPYNSATICTLGGCPFDNV